MQTLEGTYTPQVEEHWVKESLYSSLEKKYMHAVMELAKLKKESDLQK